MFVNSRVDVADVVEKSIDIRAAIKNTLVVSLGDANVCLGGDQAV